MTYIGLQAASC